MIKQTLLVQLLSCLVINTTNIMVGTIDKQAKREKPRPGDESQTSPTERNFINSG